jgi:antirestriction protein ArdC
MHDQAPRYRWKRAPASLVVARRGPTPSSAEKLDHAEDVLEAWTVHTEFGRAIACNCSGTDHIAMNAPDGLSSREAFARSLAHEQIHSNVQS